jgi:hypothetical protein
MGGRTGAQAESRLCRHPLNPRDHGQPIIFVWRTGSRHGILHL